MRIQWAHAQPQPLLPPSRGPRTEDRGPRTDGRRPTADDRPVHNLSRRAQPPVTYHQGGAFRSAEVPFPTVDNGVARSRRNFTRPQFCKQPPENLTARLARAISRSPGGRISLNLFGATSGSVLRNPTVKKKRDAAKASSFPRTKWVRGVTTESEISYRRPSSSYRKSSHASKMWFSSNFFRRFAPNPHIFSALRADLIPQVQSRPDLFPRSIPQEQSRLERTFSLLKMGLCHEATLML